MPHTDNDEITHKTEKTWKWTWSLQMNEQPGFCNDRTQHPSIKSSQLESRPLWVLNISDDGNDMKWNIWNESYFELRKKLWIWKWTWSSQLLNEQQIRNWKNSGLTGQHVHFHKLIFIRSSKNDSFHIFQNKKETGQRYLHTLCDLEHVRRKSTVENRNEKLRW